MAIYHFSTKVIGRANGSSVVAAAAREAVRLPVAPRERGSGRASAGFNLLVIKFFARRTKGLAQRGEKI